MKIKICGISSPRDAELALSEGADLLGFVFLKGPRRADPRIVREVIRRLPEGIEAVGLFRNQPLAEVRSILGESGVTIAQLNGSETPEFASALGVRVIKTFSTFTKRSLEELSRYDAFASLAEPGRVSGAKGSVDPDWAVCAKKFGRVLLSAPAGAEAIHDMIHRVRPWGVDAGTSTDTSPGVKDAGRIRALVAAVRAADLDTQKIRVTVR